MSIKNNIKPRLAEAVDLALKLGKGAIILACESDDDRPAADDTDEVAAAGPKQIERSRQRPSTDIVLSVDYACATCGISFEPASPQLFSFNSPHGMCLECDGLGEAFTFDVDRLIPDPTKSIQAGCIQTIEPWKDLSHWRRHILQGVADTIERKQGLPPGKMLETPWRDLDPALQKLWLWGTGDQHITFTWRSGHNPQKYGRKFDGIIPELLAKYRTSYGQMQTRYFEQWMHSVECQSCHGARLNPQARAVTITTQSPKFTDQPSRALPEVCHLSVADAVEFFSELRLDRTRSMIATEVLKEIRGRLGFLMNVGLDYLSLDRSAPTLSGGESQRIRLASQIGCGLVGVLYILDEPSIGLHPRDNDRLIKTLGHLRDLDREFAGARSWRLAASTRSCGRRGVSRGNTYPEKNASLFPNSAGFHRGLGLTAGRTRIDEPNRKRPAQASGGDPSCRPKRPRIRRRPHIG
jgi:excinuclease ABC subunit A